MKTGKGSLYWYIQKYGEEKGEEVFKEKRACCRGRNTLEGFVKRYGEVEGQKRYQIFLDKSVQTKEKFVLKHGMDDGVSVYEEYCDRKTRKFKNKKSYWLDQGFTDSEADQLVSAVQTKNTLPAFIDRYGEYEGTQRYFEHYVRHSYLIRLPGFIDRYGEEEGKKKHKDYCKRRGQSLENLIAKYGEEEGLKRYDLYNSKKTHTFENYQKWYGDDAESRWKENRRKWGSVGNVSKESLRFFVRMYRFCRRLGIERKDIFLGCHGSKEWSVEHNDRTFWYDFTIPKLNLVVEYNGDHVHANPDWDKTKLNEWRHAFSRATADESIEYDALKRKTIENLGFTLYYVWSNEDRETALNKLKGIIYDKLKRKKLQRTKS